MMRIITGSARGARLVAPKGETTRPTSERAKEAIFSVLQFEVQGKRVLDLFAGSGQMGLEAVSRGASFALFIDSSREALACVRANIAKTRAEDRCECRLCDALDFLRGTPTKPFDLVFLDPPYKAEVLVPALLALAAPGWLSDEATLVAEYAAEDDLFAGREALPQKFEQLRTAQYGAARVDVLKVRRER